MEWGFAVALGVYVACVITGTIYGRHKGSAVVGFLLPFAFFGLPGLVLAVVLLTV